MSSRVRQAAAALATALMFMLATVVSVLPAQADDLVSDSQSVKRAADWIAKEWTDGGYGRNDIGLVADGVMALAVADEHPDVMGDMLAVLREEGPNYVGTNPKRGDALAKLILTADMAGFDDPAHLYFEDPDHDLVEELIGMVEAKNLGPNAWGGYLAVIALARLERLDDVSSAGMDYLMSRMLVSQDGGFGWSAGAKQGDPDFTGVGISAMLLLSRSDQVSAGIKADAGAKLADAITWSGTPAEEANLRRTDEAGDYYWITYSSANSTGMLASALNEAGIDTESPRRALKREQANTTSQAAWSNTHMGTNDDVRATVQAIFGVAGVGYATGKATSSVPTPSPSPSTPTPTPTPPVTPVWHQGWCKKDEGMAVVVDFSEIEPSTWPASAKPDGWIIRCAVGTSIDKFPGDDARTRSLAAVGLKYTLEGSLVDSIEGVRGTQQPGSGDPNRHWRYTLADLGKGQATWATSPPYPAAGANVKNLVQGIRFTADRNPEPKPAYQTPTPTPTPTPTQKSFTAAKPTITGTAKAGKTLTAKVGTWSPKPSKLTYQWYRSGKAIKSATKSTYKLTDSDRKNEITVRVTGSSSGYQTLTVTSSAVKVEFGKLQAAKPKISGTAKVGKTLKVKIGTWKPKPSSYSYQWYRSGKAIQGATRASYKLTSSDKGKKLTVKVKGIKKGYYTNTSSASKATDKVK